MKTKTKIEALHVISEPGDATRYDYIVIQDDEVFYFFPLKNTFKYPTYIHKSRGTTEQDVGTIATQFECNPWTVKECIRTIKELTDEADK